MARYGVDAEQAIDAPGVYHLTVDERGRVMLPGEVREKLKIAVGDRVALMLETDGTMALKTRDVAISNLRGMFKHVAPKGRLASDELIAARRAEVRKEEQEFRERTALHRRMRRTVRKSPRTR